MTARHRYATGILIAILILTVGTGAAGAHTGFVSSSPGDGDLVDVPVAVITLTFSGEATPTGEEFVVLDSAGVVREPDRVTSSDGLTWELHFETPLIGGDVGVRWTVAAPDSHAIRGSFFFTVSASATEADGATPSESDGSPAEGALVDLEAFLAAARPVPAGAGAVAAGARIAGVVGAVLVIGGAVFAQFGLRGDPRDVRAVLLWVQRGGGFLITGAVLEATTLTARRVGEWSLQTSPTDVGEALWSSAGLAVVLRATAGALAIWRMRLDTMAASPAHDPVLAARRLATVGGRGDRPLPQRGSDEPFVYEGDEAWSHRVALYGLAGPAVAASSFMFDGHSASEGPRLLHALVNLVHVTTAAVWAGGVTMLALTIHRRRRDGRPVKALQLAMRFSVIATITVVASGVAGTALSLLVADSVADLWSTEWGRLLILKVALVGVAAAGGAYNHRVMVPALDLAPEDRSTIERFRTVVTIEAGALAGAAVVTAFMVAASAT